MKDLRDLNAEVQALGVRSDVGGDKGEPGAAGQRGSAGPKGDSGESITGEPGEDGSDGLSAFEIAVRNGFLGTEEEWVALQIPLSLEEVQNLRLLAGRYPDILRLLSGDVPEYWDGGHIDRDYGSLVDSIDSELTGDFEVSENEFLVVTESDKYYIAVTGI